jgi:flavocytochrome c
MKNVSLPESWDEETEVIVIGSGFAGLAAAIEAKNAGNSVIILEKMKGYGGNSVISDGVVAVPGTAFQENAGIKDTPQLMLEDMLEAGLNLNHPELVGTLVEHAADTFQWTIDYLGVTYRDQVLRLGGHSIPRTHITGKNSGSEIIKKQIEKVKSLGIRVRTRVCLENILKDSDERVCGVTVREGYQFPDQSSGVRKFIKAKKGVVLATGGFASDVEFRSIHDPRLTDNVDSTNKYSTTAEALKEALRIGAMPIHLSWIQLGPWTSPDEKFYGIAPEFSDYIVFQFGIMVDPQTGKRIVNELDDRKVMSDAILNTGHPCIGIADARGVEVSGYRVDHCLRKGIAKAFSQISDIAEHYEIPSRELMESIESYNSYVDEKLDPIFGKPILDNAEPLSNPPYYCIRLWPKVHHTMGGVLINGEAQVLNLSKQPIKGFYAAGEVTGGVHGASRLVSCAIIDCLVFGRIAGKNAAKS